MAHGWDTETRCRTSTASAGTFSNNELNLQMNTPGDPFETDGANWTLPSHYSDSGLMNGVRVMRNRYFGTPRSLPTAAASRCW